MGREIQMEPAPPLEGLWRDPGSTLELRPGDVFEDVYQYNDGHTEHGRARYTGDRHRTWVNDWESIIVPILDALSPLSRGEVRIVGRKRV